MLFQHGFSLGALGHPGHFPGVVAKAVPARLQVFEYPRKLMALVFFSGFKNLKIRHLNFKNCQHESVVDGLMQ